MDYRADLTWIELRNVSDRDGAHLDRKAVVLGCIALCLGLQAWLALVMEINWDEFYFLALIYDFQRGALAVAPQTFHVHLLGWLTGIGGDEMRQVEAGRFFMLACEAGTCALIYALARTFFGQTASLIAALAYAAAGFTIIHGASFRADPLAATLIMASLVLVARARLTAPSASAAGLAAALSALVTVKVVFFAPAFVGMAVWRWAGATDRNQLGRWLMLAAVAAASAFLVLYSIHMISLPKATNAAAEQMMGGAARTTIFEAGFLPRTRELVQWMILSPIQTALILIGTAIAAAGILRNGRRARSLHAAVLLCAAPLLSLLFYRNGFPYFFAFILPPACLLAALACEQWPRLLQYILLPTAGLAFSSIVVGVIWSKQAQAPQQQLIRAVHRIFPQPVAYIDRNSMIASFPKQGFFMSTWGRINYQRGAPLFADILAKEAVPLLIVNSPTLEHALGLRGPVRPDLALFPEDQAVLRTNFIRHWGRIWVAGQQVPVGTRPTAIQINVPGTYTLEGAAAEIDARSISVGEAIDLGRGRHVLRAPRSAMATLRWGDNLPLPVEEPIAAPVFVGF